MKVLLAPMGAMAETSGPFSRVAALSNKLLEQEHQVALCAALDVNYHKIDKVKNYDCPIPSPFGLPLAIGKRMFGLAQRLGIQRKKKVHSFEQVLFFTGAIQRKLFEKDVFAIRQAIRDFQPVAPRGEDRIMCLQHRPVAVEEPVEVRHRRIGARRPGDLVVAQAVDPDRIDLDHAEAQGLRGRAIGSPERPAQAQAIEQEGAGEFVRHAAAPPRRPRPCR